MIILKILLGIIGIIVVLIISIQYLTCFHNIVRAIIFEKQKNYKKAIYSYATAISNVPLFLFEFMLYARIKSLSRKYGPFNYDDILWENYKKEGEDAPDSCSVAGDAIVTSIINEALNKNL